VNIFTISQPSHFLIAKCLSKSLKNKINIFYVLSNSPLIKKINNFLNEVDSNIKIIYLDDHRPCVYKNNNILIQIANIRFLKKDLSKRSIDSLYIFNDFRPDVKAVIYYFKKFNLRGKVILMDEGMPLYYDIDWSPKYPIYKIIIFKLVYGFWWKETRRIGETKNIDKYMVFHPDKVNKNISPCAVEKLNIDLYDNLNILNKLPSRKIDIFILLEKHSFEYKTEVDSIVQYCLDRKIKTVIKLHPSIEQLNINWMDYFLYDKIEYLETAVPLELYFQKNKQTKFLVLSVGVASSALISCRLFNPGTMSAILFKSDLWPTSIINHVEDLRSRFDLKILSSSTEFFDFYEKN